jgi:hypothetical protein
MMPAMKKNTQANTTRTISRTLIVIALLLVAHTVWWVAEVEAQEREYTAAALVGSERC